MLKAYIIVMTILYLLAIIQRSHAKQIVEATIAAIFFLWGVYLLIELRLFN